MVRRYKRLDPATMTEEQLRGWKKRNSVTCSTCNHAKYVERNGETHIICGNPDNKNGDRLIKILVEGIRKKVNRPSWCVLRQNGVDGS